MVDIKTEQFMLAGIPAILWGETAGQVIIAVHGNMSDKADVPIRILAELAVPKGYQVLSFDLPEHGDRKEENTRCKVQNCVKELDAVMKYAKQHYSRISLWANSMGAYFSLQAYQQEEFKQSLFLSPLVDMERMIENMMGWFQVTPERLEEAQEIETPIGQTLYWDYYCYVKEHPIEKWESPTEILYGERDDMCEYEGVAAFAERFGCEMTVVKDGEHYFHTEEQLETYREWLEKRLLICCSKS